MKNAYFISASAGTGKTYELTRRLVESLATGKTRIDGVIATTFTNRAADELQERVRMKLLESNQIELAQRLDQALIGTVHGICGRLLNRFAFDAGLSPESRILNENESRALFHQVIEEVVSAEVLQQLQTIGDHFSERDSYQGILEPWKKHVASIVNHARANCFTAEQLPAMAKKIWNEWSNVLPQVAAENLREFLEHSLRSTIQAIKQKNDKTKKTRKYLNSLQAYLPLVQRNALPWSNWIKIVRGLTNDDYGPAKACLPFIHDLALIASRFPTCAQFQNDIQNYTFLLFYVAEKALEKFQFTKEKYGVMDFNDQEQRALKLLDQPFVQKVLRQELDLLLIDEFQDTSPIQLAIFQKLSALTRETVIVGDMKQSIYGFRGTDPKLMQAVMRRHLDLQPLSTSWRSRSGLIQLCNVLFRPAFQQAFSLDEKSAANLINVQPCDDRQTDILQTPPVLFWNIIQEQSRPSNKEYFTAIAEGIFRFLQNKIPIFDKQAKSPRSIQLSDIAILCRKRSTVAACAETLSQCGINTTTAQHGLLDTPEARLALACLRRIYDRTDELATAEIIALQATLAPEQWIEQRLQYLTRQTDETLYSWGIEEQTKNPVIEALEHASQQLPFLAPSEILDFAIIEGRIPQTISTWGPNRSRAIQRLANIEQIRSFTRQYETSCQSMFQPPTVLGLLHWLDDLRDNEEDFKASDEDTDAVHVLTYHAAKGLEWPIVICCELDEETKTRLWDIQIVADDPRKKFDIDQPLSNRRMRYWIWPFGKQEQGIDFIDQLENTPEGLAAREAAGHEDLRLLYVALTRARDYLVIPWIEGQRNHWLELLHAPWFKPHPTSLTLPDKTSIPCETWTLKASENTSLVSDPSYPWFAHSELKQPLPLAHIPASRYSTSIQSTIGRTLQLPLSITVRKPYSELDLGNALHSIFSTFLIHPHHPQQNQRITSILHSYSLEKNCDVQNINDYLDEFLKFLNTTFQPKRIHVEVPSHLVLPDTQAIDGFIDLLLETPDGWILIDHKTSNVTASTAPSKALSYTSQLAAYRQTLTAVTPLPLLSQWIHFPLAGMWIEIK